MKTLKKPITGTPAANKIWLHLTAGIVWSGVGIMLSTFAAGWFALVHSWTVILYLVAGLVLAAAIYFFGFSKLAIRNLQRINQMPKERNCIFAFQKWTSYPLVAVMMGMGIYLRHYAPIPKPYLAIFYLGLGASLFASSLLYYAEVISRLRAPVSPAPLQESGAGQYLPYFKKEK